LSLIYAITTGQNLLKPCPALNQKISEVTMKVLMVGATGKYANLVVPELKQRDVTVLALVRDESKSDAARQQRAAEAVSATV
jgi:hypothetical protein